MGNGDPPEGLAEVRMADNTVMWDLVEIGVGVVGSCTCNNKGSDSMEELADAPGLGWDRSGGIDTAHKLGDNHFCLLTFHH